MKSESTAAKILGLFVVPAVGMAATGLVAPIVVNTVGRTGSDKDLYIAAGTGTAIYAASAAAALAASRTSKLGGDERSFAKGGYWGALALAVSAIPVTALYLANKKAREAGPKIAGVSDTDNLRLLAGALAGDPQSLASHHYGAG